MSEPLHPSQLMHYIDQRNRANLASLGLAFGVAVCAGLVGAFSDVRVKLASATVGTAIGIAARPIRKNAIAVDRLLNDIDDISHTNLQKWMLEATAPQQEVSAMVQLPPAQLEEFPQIQPFLFDRDIGELRRHIFLLGATRDGKTTLCRYLLTLLNGYHLVLDPHAAPDKWPGLAVVGGGRDFGSIRDALLAVHQVMVQRFAEMHAGRSQFDQINLIIDEFPAIAGKTSEAGDTVKAVLPEILREAYKIGIRVVLLAQGSEVKTLGIEGEGSIRDQLSFIRLGNFALKHGKPDEELHTILKQQKRPCMVDDGLGEVPNLANFQPVYRLQQMPVDLQRCMDACEDVVDIEDDDQDWEDWQLFQQCGSISKFAQTKYGARGGTPFYQAKARVEELKQMFG